MKMLKYVFLIVAIIILFTACKSKDSTSKDGSDVSAKNLTIEETKEFIKNQDDLFILDVRNKDEFDSGHIEGAVLIPLNELKDRLHEIEEYKDNPILVYCRSGNRSSQAVKILLNNDFTQIYHMNKGYMNWK